MQNKKDSRISLVFTIKKADGQAFRIAEVQKSAGLFLLGLDF